MMRGRATTYQLFALFILLVNCQFMKGQSIANGIPYQTIVRNNAGLPITNQMVGIKLGIYSGSATGPLQWEETYSKITDQNGYVKLVIGNGTTTGAGASPSFASINWATGNYYFKLAIDISGGSSYIDIGSSKLLSVPYSFYSLTSDALTTYYLDQLLDVNVPSPLTGNLLKWNGAIWIAAKDNDSDTVLFAYNTFHSIHSDTSVYALSSSVLFAYYADTSQYSQWSLNSLSTTDAVHSDTAIYAFASAPNGWTTTGNTIGSGFNTIGTPDAQDIVLKTNNTETLRINSSGNVFSLNAANTFNLSLNGNDGIICAGTLGTATVSASGAGTKLLWYPNKAAFRAGGVSSNQWGDANIGNYSFATGHNCIAGISAFAAGDSCIANGTYGVALGNKCQAQVTESYALGDSSISSSGRGVAIGKGNTSSTNNAAYAIGFYNTSTGAISSSFGTHSTASGSYSFAFGYYGSTNFKTGSFVYADASSSSITNSTANNQFLVRASGGVNFYSDSLNTMGVTLPAGGGSWASVSDKNKKENFTPITDREVILNKIEKLKITSWTYISQDRSIRHIGPMSQDFYKAFHIGEDSKSISMIDIDGLTLLGIKFLDQRIKLLSALAKVNELNSRLKALDDFSELNSRLDKVEGKLLKK